MDVDDAEIDAVIEKLDSAIAKYNRLTNVNVDVNADVETKTEQINLVLEESNIVKSEIESALLQAINTTTEIELKEKQAQQLLTTIQANAETAEASLMSGTSRVSRQALTMLPFGSEIMQVYSFVQSFLSYGLTLGAIIALITAMRFLLDWQRQKDRELKEFQEYRQSIMEARGFVKFSEFDQYQDDIRRALNDYQSGVVP
jgi:ABC-type transporter Mla subunit MlaD